MLVAVSANVICECMVIWLVCRANVVVFEFGEHLDPSCTVRCVHM